MRISILYALITCTVVGLAHAQGQHPFSTTASMNSPRFGHTATLLPTGQVLILGGYSGMAAVNTAEIFDPKSETFVTVPNVMISSRCHHTATLLPSGKVLITGGRPDFVSVNLDTAEIFDPATQSFTSLPSMTTPRCFHTATMLPDGGVLIAGGGAGNTAEVFESSSGGFRPTLGLMTMKRSTHTATLLPDGKVLIAGGFGASGGTATAELFDPKSETFTSLAPNSMTSVRYIHTATLLPTGKVLLAAGCSASGFADIKNADLYDSASQTFARALPGILTTPRLAHTATLLQSGKVLLTGGETGTFRTETAELFDPQAVRFDPLLPETMARMRAGHTATLLADGRVLLVGGFTDEHLNVGDSTAELYDPAAGTSGFPSQAIRSITFLKGHLFLQGNTTPNRDVVIYGSVNMVSFSYVGGVRSDENGMFQYDGGGGGHSSKGMFRFVLP